MYSYSHLINRFNKVLATQFAPDEALASEVAGLLEFGASANARSEKQMDCSLIAEVNARFRLNGAEIKRFLSLCAKRRVTFNYHEKSELSAAYDRRDLHRIDEVLVLKKAMTRQDAQQLLTDVRFISEPETIRRLHCELDEPTLTRIDSKSRDWSNEILTGLFVAYACSALEPNVVHAFNSGAAFNEPYEPDFWLYLKKKYPSLHSTKPSLILVGASGNTTREELLAKIEESYQTLPNFGHLAVWLDFQEINGNNSLWSMFSDALIFAEKHVRRVPRQQFFRQQVISNATARHIPELNIKAAEFEIWNDGFHYQDCFVIGPESKRLLVLLQKREADETPIPCPSCRSLNVHGNSYSSLGVKSWECGNTLCLAKSKFGRGKRYSFVQLLKQAAIEEPGNDIPKASVRSWLRDVQAHRSDAEILEMLARHYTLSGDTILVDGVAVCSEESFGRKLLSKKIPTHKAKAYKTFFNSSFFSRFDIPSTKGKPKSPAKMVQVKSLKAYLGEAGSVLASFADSSVDGAVTSPPYYNAREYSQWENIYTYLYDMRRINAEVFRVLKPGAYYLYNIFDYFDNENNVVLSAMGDKRVILGAYTAEIFQRIGFELAGNIPWDKGDIEGKRGFNGGNFSPYYQAPFNCWEHILVFRKPGGDTSDSIQFPSMLRHPAVIKIVRGENTHGHSAPYPEAVPALLAERLKSGSVILDPFGGSMTTALAADRNGCTSMCIEQDSTYFQLGIERFKRAISAST